MPKLFLIDGMSLVFRAYHAMIRSGLQSPSGEPTGAVFGFTNTITSLLEKEKPEHIAVVFDTKEPTFRHERYPEYKANRDEFPEELVPQLARIKEEISFRAEQLGHLERTQPLSSNNPELLTKYNRLVEEIGLLEDELKALEKCK